MRTTVTIHDDLYREVKARAAVTGQTVGTLIEEALRLMIARIDQSPTELPKLPRSDMGLRPGLDVTDNSSVQDFLDEQDMDTALHARR